VKALNEREEPTALEIAQDWNTRLLGMVGAPPEEPPVAESVAEPLECEIPEEN
jgi:hypothetical protein